MIGTLSGLLLLFAVAALTAGYLYFKERQNTASTLSRYSAIIDNEAERARLAAVNAQLKEEIATARQRLDQEHQSAVARHRKEIDELVSSSSAARQRLEAEYQAALARYQGLMKEISSAEESLEDMSVGLYNPHFTFETTEEYKAKITEIRLQQKVIVGSGRATRCAGD